MSRGRESENECVLERERRGERERESVCVCVGVLGVQYPYGRTTTVKWRNHEP
jgi:hypothetical protein